ncbi:hypothetical protein RRG08_034855 [Elysia crispata]|uniref:C-type lectin domain-containing protein n=1 Tax=Elysia crispata TaxID=231223 RepID=A0AAE1AM76_9GAST|nr:hypothetical protein RRG08_034855 [Elysia crispata]
MLSLFLSSAATASKPGIRDTCPYGLVRSVNPFHLQVFIGTCFYFVVNERLEYKEAKLKCSTFGGLSALPKTETLNNYLTNQSQHYYGVGDELWIGLHDEKDKRTFIWEDKEELTWENFAGDNGPDNNWFIELFEDCVALNPMDGFWYEFW